MKKIILLKKNYDINELTYNNLHNLKINSLINYVKKNTNYNIPTNLLNNKLYLVNIIRKKIYNMNKIKSPYEIIYNFMINYYLSILGNCFLKNISINIEDFYTQKDIKKISDIYLFCIPDYFEIYSFDIRTLYYMYLLNNKENKNPYTRNSICCETLLKIKKKLDFLKKNNFLIYHYNYLKINSIRNINHNEIIYSLHSLDYDIDIIWINNLSVFKLKKLYFEIYNIWIHSNLSIESKYRIININNGDLFKDYNDIKKLKDKNIIINILFNILNRLINEGINNDYKKIGSLYFLSGLVKISNEAKKIYYYLI